MSTARSRSYPRADGPVLTACCSPQETTVAGGAELLCHCQRMGWTSRPTDRPRGLCTRSTSRLLRLYCAKPLNHSQYGRGYTADNRQCTVYCECTADSTRRRLERCRCDRRVAAAQQTRRAERVEGALLRLAQCPVPNAQCPSAAITHTTHCCPPVGSFRAFA